MGTLSRIYYNWLKISDIKEKSGVPHSLCRFVELRPIIDAGLRDDGILIMLTVFFNWSVRFMICSWKYFPARDLFLESYRMCRAIRRSWQIWGGGGGVWKGFYYARFNISNVMINHVWWVMGKNYRLLT